MRDSGAHTVAGVSLRKCLTITKATYLGASTDVFAHGSEVTTKRVCGPVQRNDPGCAALTLRMAGFQARNAWMWPWLLKFP